MIKVILCGILGRLGSEVLAACEKSGDIEVVCGIDSAAVLPAQGPPVFSSFCCLLPEADAVVDCSAPTLQKQVLDYCVQNRLSLLSCVTGYTDEQEHGFKMAAEKIAVIRCVNMASGLAQFLHMLLETVKVLQVPYAEIVETHRIGKKDTPSGTALLIADMLRQTGCEVSVSSVRKLNAHGSHEVTLYFASQEIALRHTVCSTAAYGEGAVPLIRRVLGLKAGLYELP
ncbi:MAG: hypothetical protein IKV55_04050 [Oscillospiraceae bacterium]|nr:hypothetical protein [Oscillospiraceae bacterium]